MIGNTVALTCVHFAFDSNSQRLPSPHADGPPVRPNISLGDSLAGLHAAFGAVMALLHRHRTGDKQGQVVDVSISESIFNMLEGCIPEWFEHGVVRPPSGSTITGVVPSGTWRAADGKYVIIGGNGNSGEQVADYGGLKGKCQYEQKGSLSRFSGHKRC